MFSHDRAQFTPGVYLVLFGGGGGYKAWNINKGIYFLTFLGGGGISFLVDS